MKTRTRRKAHNAVDHLAAAAALPRQVSDLAPAASSLGASVIVPTYNRRELVLQTLEALSQQEDVSFEVIAVDDGSKDGTFDAIVKKGRELGLAGCAIRLESNHGPADARNVGVLQAKADILAFTDSDCLPSAGWLKAGLAAMRPGVSFAQGPTRPPEGSSAPFFSHFMHIERLDGTFSTCNAFYARAALVEAGGFNPKRIYCEDLDLGWRIQARNGVAVYAPEAVVYHQIIKQSPLEWLRWPGRLKSWPANIARHPEGRAYLYARYWVSPAHAALTLALAGIVMTPAFPPALLLAAPYAVGFVDRYEFSGKWPLAKAALHLWWDVSGWLTLAGSSIKHRTLVL